MQTGYSTISSQLFFYFKFWYFIFLHKIKKIFICELLRIEKAVAFINYFLYCLLQLAIGSFVVCWSVHTIGSVNRDNKRRKERMMCLTPKTVAFHNWKKKSSNNNNNNNNWQVCLVAFPIYAHFYVLYIAQGINNWHQINNHFFFSVKLALKEIIRFECIFFFFFL